MYRDQSILAIITARGGSKGIKNKNIIPCNGFPLIYWTIKASSGSKYIDKTILSSEDEKIIATAKSYGCEVPFRRPHYLATDRSSSVEVVLHAIAQVSEKYDYILLLQPTSPLRNCRHIDEAIEYAIAKNLNSLVSICLVKDNPRLMYLASNDGKLVPFIETNGSTTRQDFQTYVRPNGAIYLIRTESFEKEQKFILPDTCGYMMNRTESIDIDEPEDLFFAELLMQNVKNI